ncbi:MAG: MBG domain-containing protein, partial [Chitinophagaceae bacterium]
MVTTRDGDHGDILATNINAFRSVNRDWTVTTLGGTLLSTFGAKFSWSAQDQDPNFDYNNAVVAKYADNFWIYPSVSTRETNSIQVDTILGTGVFQIGKGCAFTKITTQPKNERICVGASALLTVEATGDNGGDFTYQWMKDGQSVNGANGASFLANGIGNFSVLVSGECRSDVSQNAVVSYKLPTVVTMNPGAGTKCAGELIKVGASGDGPLFYQWKKDGIDIPGATDSTFAVREIGKYSVEVVGDCGRATSDDADIELYKPTRVLNQPVNVSITYGESTNFTILADGTGSLSYKWQKQANDPELGIAAVPETIQDATTDTLQLNKPDGTLDGTRYRCIVTGFCGDTATRWVILTINKAPLVITLDSVRRVYGDANPSFTVSYSGFVHDEAPGNSDL